MLLLIVVDSCLFTNHIPFMLLYLTLPYSFCFNSWFILFCFAPFLPRWRTVKFTEVYCWVQKIQWIWHYRMYYEQRRTVRYRNYQVYTFEVAVSDLSLFPSYWKMHPYSKKLRQWNGKWNKKLKHGRNNRVRTSLLLYNSHAHDSRACKNLSMFLLKLSNYHLFIRSFLNQLHCMLTRRE